MLQIGNWVKVNTSHCDEVCPRCQSPGFHVRYHGRYGRLEANFKGLDHNHGDGRVRCACGFSELPKDFYARTEHWNIVCFNGEHASFADAELEDMGQDLTRVIQEWREHERAATAAVA